MMKWKIPLFDLDLGKEEIEALRRVLRSKWLTMGEVTKKFEGEFAKYLGVKYAFAVSSGTAALHIAQQVLGIGKGDEVVCPSFTFVATANSILYTGAKPVFADITSPDELNISPGNILGKITPRTKAITVVHYGGYPCEMDKIMEIARRHGVYVIEDAAHAPGAEYRGKKCGTIGDIGCFSFFSNKNMTTGEGGMVVTDNDKFAQRIKLLRTHGMTTLTLDRYKGHAYTYDVTDLGYNYRIDEIRSAIGIVQLEKLEKNNTAREKRAEVYRKGLRNVADISIPFEKLRGKSSFHIFPVLVEKADQRKRFIEALKKKGIQTSIHYLPIHLFKYYRGRFGFKSGMLPITEDVAKREVTLPLYPGLTEKDSEYVIQQIKNIKL